MKEKSNKPNYITVHTSGYYHKRLLYSSVASVSKILQRVLRDLIYLLKKFFPRRQALSLRLAVEYSPAVVYEIVRLCTENFTKGTAYCKVKELISDLLSGQDSRP